MVPFFRRATMALAIAVALLFTVDRDVAHAIGIVCDQACNTCLVGCPPNAVSCTVSNDFEAPAGCVLDFGNRNVVFKGTFDVGSSALTVTARAITVQGQLKARSETTRGGTISLTANGDATHSGDIIVTAGRIDVAGNSAGLMRLTAAGKIDLQSTTPLVANGNQGGGAGTINLVAGTSIRQGGDVSATGGTQSDGGSISYRAGSDIDVLRRIDAIGGVLDGGDVDLIAGDDITIEQPIDASGNNGGAGGSISARAGADVLGGVKPGGALQVIGNLKGDGSSDVDGGVDGGDISLSALGPIAVAGAIHATGGPAPARFVTQVPDRDVAEIDDAHLEHGNVMTSSGFARLLTRGSAMPISARPRCRRRLRSPEAPARRARSAVWRRR